MAEPARRVIFPQRILTGAGSLLNLPQLIKDYLPGEVILVLARSFAQTNPRWDELAHSLQTHRLAFREFTLSGEPSPGTVDTIKAAIGDTPVAAVVAIGGGSVLDTGKALAAMIGRQESVRDYLEGVGREQPDGRKRPFIAVPTTAGTGSEATNNAVLSEPGPQGFKNSLRHDAYVPDLVILDCECLLSCPPSVLAATALDALAQLLEGYVATTALALTDALAWSGLEQISAALHGYSQGDWKNPEILESAQIAAFFSGVVLANAGLGTVHGLAGPLGSRVKLPHGVACGRLLPAVLAQPYPHTFLDEMVLHTYARKIARIGRLLSRQPELEIHPAREALIHFLRHLLTTFRLPKLSDYGVTREMCHEVARLGSNKQFPLPFSESERYAILNEAMV